MHCFTPKGRSLGVHYLTIYCFLRKIQNFGNADPEPQKQEVVAWRAEQEAMYGSSSATSCPAGFHKVGVRVPSCGCLSGQLSSHCLSDLGGQVGDKRDSFTGAGPAGGLLLSCQVDS